jgi:hypothetical protein
VVVAVVACFVPVLRNGFVAWDIEQNLGGCGLGVTVLDRVRGRDVDSARWRTRARASPAGSRS